MGECLVKAWLWKGVNQLEMVELPIPACPDGWVRIRVHGAGVCSTDVHILRGRFFNGSPPHVLGHEIAGEVVALGHKVPAEWLGKRVVVETAVGCGQCLHCRSGNKHLCDHGAEIGFPPYQGGYAEYTIAPWSCLHELPGGMTYDEAGILEAVACPVGAVQRIGMALGETVFIAGAGAAGLSFIQAAKAFHARKIIVSVRRDIRAKQAYEFGATTVVDIRRENLPERILEETGGEGVNLAIDAVGASGTIQDCVAACRKGGRVLLYGLPDENEAITIPVSLIIMRQLRLYGVTNNEMIWDPLLELVKDGTINISRMVTHTFGMEQLPQAMELVETHSDSLIKAVLHPLC